MKYKVGDKVRIKSLDWYNENKNNEGVIICESDLFTHPMSHFCNEVVSIITIQDGCYRILEDDGDWYWTDEMIEGLVEEENNDCEECGLTRNSTRCLFMDNCPHSKQKNIIEIPKDYVLKDENGNVINATKIVLEKKKKEYPKTYEECCKVLEISSSGNGTDGYKWEILTIFQNLIIYRDAYWKIAGEEMGLGKPWKPDWTNNNEVKFIIGVSENEIIKCYNGIAQYILAFPTAEMRDAFYENFKELIESCKELL